MIKTKLARLFYRMNPLSGTLTQVVSELDQAHSEIERLNVQANELRRIIDDYRQDLARKDQAIEAKDKDLENYRKGQDNLHDRWNNFFGAIAQFDATLSFKAGGIYEQWCYIISFQPRIYYPSVDLYNKRPFLFDQGNPRMITEIIRSFGLENWNWNEQTVTLSRRYSDISYMGNIGRDMEEATDYLQGHINRMLNTETYQRILCQNTMKGGDGKNGNYEEASSKAS